MMGFVVAAVLLALLGVTVAATGKKANIVLIVADDQGHAQVRCMCALGCGGV